MVMFTTTDITDMKREGKDALPGTCNVSRPTLTSNNAGGYTEAWAVVTTATECRVQQGGGPNERLLAERLGVTSAWTITFQVGTDVRPTDRVVTLGRTFEVHDIVARTWEVVRRCLCTEVK